MVTATLLYIRGVCDLRFFQSQWIIERSMAFYCFRSDFTFFSYYAVTGYTEKAPDFTAKSGAFSVTKCPEHR